MRPLIPALAIALAAAPALAGPREDAAAAAAVIDAVNADWIPAMRAKDAARVGAAYASDAVNISSAGQVIEGHEAFVARLRKQFDAGMTVSGGSIRRQGLEPLSPGLLLEWGEAGFDARMADGREVKVMGPYVTVWRRAGDGQWRIIRNQSF